LYPSDLDTLLRTTKSAIDLHLEADIPPQKIVVGVAIYGRGWTEVNPENNGLLQPFGKWYGFIHYSELKEKYIDKNGFEHHWDDAAKAPFLWNPESRTFISYDDSESLMNKTSFIRERGLGGAMYWHHAYDPSEELLNVLFKGLK
jgi:chitinase